MGISGNLLKLIKSFLSNRFQRVLLNGQTSDWASIRAGVPQGSILGPLFFLVYINDLSNNLSSSVKLFADDTSIFSTVHDVNVSSNQLNDDLRKVSVWAYNWKMSFNPDPSKQAQEVIFTRKLIKPSHPTLFFNNLPVQKTMIQKHLGLFLDDKLNFNHHLKEKITKVNKGIAILRKLHNTLPRQSLITIYKSFIRPHLDYGDIIYDQPKNESFCQRLESVQYNAALAITGAIRGTSQEKLYKELGLESLKSRRWFRRLCIFYKIQSTQTPYYLFKLIPTAIHSYNIRSLGTYNTYYCRTDMFKNSFFPYTVNEWNKLDSKICASKSFLTFRNSLLRLIRPPENLTFDIQNPVGLKLLTRLRLGLSHLNEHKFRHNFQDCLNPLCTCSLETENTIHYFLHCHHYCNIRKTLMSDVKSIDECILSLPSDSLVNVLLFGDPKYNRANNSQILNASIKYILQSERFAVSLF